MTAKAVPVPRSQPRWVSTGRRTTVVSMPRSAHSLTKLTASVGVVFYLLSRTLLNLAQLNFD